MHDQLTVAFDLRYPWPWPRQHWPGERKAPREVLVTIWHRDPETDGTDDSCDWFGSRLTDAERAAARGLWANEVDNLRPSLDHMHPDDREIVLLSQWQAARRWYAPRPWWKHPRWHIWHWRVQVHPLQQFKRWAFSRCAVCGGRFPWGYAPVTTLWDAPGPRWFRAEPAVRHHGCAEAAA
jgi:hypothetical protein